MKYLYKFSAFCLKTLFKEFKWFVIFLMVLISSTASAQTKYFTGESNDIDGNGTADFDIAYSDFSYYGSDYFMYMYMGTFSPQDELQIQFGTQTVGVYSLVEFNNFGDTIGTSRQWSSEPKTIYFYENTNYVENWQDESFAFIGIRIKNGDLFRYGWLRITTTFDCHVLDGAIQETAGIPILAGEGINTIKPLDMKVSDLRNNGNWSDISVDFFSPYFNSYVEEFRVFAVKADDAQNLSVEDFMALPESRYLVVENEEVEYNVVLNSVFLDVDGDKMDITEEYRICVVSVSDSVEIFPHGFSLSPVFQINTVLPEVSTLTAEDFGDEGTSEDLKVTFAKNTREDMMKEYRLLIVPKDSAKFFTLEKAIQIPEEYSFGVEPVGDSVYSVENKLLKDIFGNPVHQDQLYQVFILSVPDGVNSNIASLSSVSNTFSLGTPDYLYAGQKEGIGINYYDFEPDLEEDTIRFDFDQDGKSELVFTNYSNWKPSVIFDYWEVTTEDSTQIIITDNDIATNLSLHSSINHLGNWGSGTFYLNFEYSAGWGPATKKGEFLYEGIVGFRKNSVNDTIYGWIHVHCQYPTKIYDYAWQKRVTQSVIKIPDSGENLFVAYPNPNRDRVLNIAIKNFGGEKDSFLDVFNSSGIKMKRIVVTEQLSQINLNGMPGGLYYVQLVTPEKQETQKILVQ